MTPQQDILLKRITIKPNFMQSKPTIRGLRFPVADILELLANGLSEEDIVEQHPILEKEDIRAALIYSATKINEDLIHE
ncbi:DUF433 domain-containing protein [Pedobacter nototheniae]|uniref:DUF433 domain-containing protein n=1 Tax=Pedobacter nototheniae TaxID=2488994 RepID=UPI00103D8422|nr:DUF433 domain-containing protein [Pedobacter nototheniae]